MATDGFAPQLQASRALIHVDIDARQIGKSYSPTHADRRVRRRAPRRARRSPARTSQPGDARASLDGVERHALAVVDEARPDRAARRDRRAPGSCCPRDTIYTVDSGEHFLFATQYLEITEPDAFVVMTGLGSMGQSIGAAIGAQLAHPDRTVAAICRRRLLRDERVRDRDRGARAAADPRVRVQRRTPRHGRERPREGLRPPPAVPDRAARRLLDRARPRRARCCASTASISSPRPLARFATRGPGRHRRPDRPRIVLPKQDRVPRWRRAAPTPATPHPARHRLNGRTDELQIRDGRCAIEVARSSPAAPICRSSALVTRHGGGLVMGPSRIGLHSKSS